MRIALTSYRSKPHVGGQGVYVRHLSRELVALGHTVEVFSGQPYPALDPGVLLTAVPSLDLYREPDPFRLTGQRGSPVVVTAQRGDLRLDGRGQPVHERLTGLPRQLRRLVRDRHGRRQVAEPGPTPRLHRQRPGQHPKAALGT